MGSEWSGFCWRRMVDVGRGPISIYSGIREGIMLTPGEKMRAKICQVIKASAKSKAP